MSNPGLNVSMALVACAMVAGCGKNSAGDEGQAIETVVAVQSGTIERGTLHGYVQAYGEVAPDPGSATNPAARLVLTAPAAGVVKTVRCIEGQKVAAGDVLFEMDSSAADIAVKEAQSALGLAQENLARQEKLLEIQAAPEKAVQEARQQLAAAQAAAAKAAYERSLGTVRAAQDGTVIRVAATQGASVNAADALAEIWDLDRLLVLARVPAREAAPLAVGQNVLMDGGAAAGEEGTLVFIADRVDPADGTIGVRIAPAHGTALHCGQFVSVRVVCTEHAGCLSVPEESIVLSPDGAASIAVIDGDRAVVHPVTIGLKDRGRVEVSGEGLQAGMKVVTAGAYGLPDQTRIRILAR